MAGNEIPNKRRGRLIRYAPLILWLGVIFFLSSGQGSMAETSRFIRPIIEFFFPSAAPDTFLIVHALIRKTAHFVEYAVLAMFTARAFSTSTADVLRRHWILFSFALVVLIAIIDESNQSFETSRTGSIWDVLLDIGGGVTAIFIYFLITHRIATRVRASENQAKIVD